MLLHAYKVKRYVAYRIPLKWILGDLIEYNVYKGNRFQIL